MNRQTTRLNLVQIFSLKKHGLVRNKWRAYKAKKKEDKAFSLRQKSQAKFIGITGSSAKSTTTALLAHVLASKGKVRAQVQENLYNGLLETILQLEEQDEFVVAETAVAKPGDMKPTAALLRPDVAIVTMIAMEHYSNFKTKEAIANEKSRLISALNPLGMAVLNADDLLVMEMKNLTKARCISFGWSENADYRVTRLLKEAGKPLVITLKKGNASFEVSCNFMAEHFWLSMAAVTATALELGVSLEQIQERMQSFQGVFGRCSLYEIKEGPTFILDTAKAPYHSLETTFNSIEKETSTRKWIILGQLSDYAGNPRNKYRNAYNLARKVADKVVFIGDHSHRSGATDETINSGDFSNFKDFSELLDFSKKNLNKKDLILIKSSQRFHLERIALSFNHEVKCMINNCGYDFSCYRCGMFEHAFEDHKQIRKAIRSNGKAIRNV